MTKSTTVVAPNAEQFDAKLVGLQQDYSASETQQAAIACEQQITIGEFTANVIAAKSNSIELPEGIVKKPSERDKKTYGAQIETWTWLQKNKVGELVIEQAPTAVSGARDRASIAQTNSKGDLILAGHTKSGIAAATHIAVAILNTTPQAKGQGNAWQLQAALVGATRNEISQLLLDIQGKEVGDRIQVKEALTVLAQANTGSGQWIMAEEEKEVTFKGKPYLVRQAVEKEATTPPERTLDDEIWALLLQLHKHGPQFSGHIKRLATVCAALDEESRKLHLKPTTQGKNWRMFLMAAEQQVSEQDTATQQASEEANS